MFFREQKLGSIVMYMLALLKPRFQVNFSTVRGYNLRGKTALIDIDRKEVFHAYSSSISLFAPVPRPRGCEPARRKYQFRRVEQHGCREEIMSEDTHRR